MIERAADYRRAQQQIPSLLPASPLPSRLARARPSSSAWSKGPAIVSRRPAAFVATALPHNAPRSRRTGTAVPCLADVVAEIRPPSVEYELHTFADGRRVMDNFVRRIRGRYKDAKIMMYMGRGKTTHRIHFHILCECRTGRPG